MADSIADSLSEGLAGLNFPPPSQGSGNIPAAFRGGNPKRRDKKK